MLFGPSKKMVNIHRVSKQKGDVSHPGVVGSNHAAEDK